MAGTIDHAHRFVALDSLRGICAILVALFHFRITSHLNSLAIVQHGWLFVDFFFVLSGFVLAHAYGERLQSGQVDGFRFMLLRLGRIYPLHFFMLVVMIVFEVMLMTGGFSSVSERVPFSGSRDVVSVFSNLAMLHSFGVHDRLTWNIPSWSIAAEMWVYLLFALVFSIARRNAPMVMLALGALAFIVLLNFSANAMNTTFDFGFLRCVVGFSVGIGVQRIYASGVRNTGSMGELLAVLLAVAFVTFSGSGASTFFAPIVFGFAVWVFASEAGSLSRWLHGRTFVWLGTISYSIYMVHAVLQARVGDLVYLGGSAVGLSLDGRTGGLNEFPTEIISAPLWLGDLIVLVMLVAVCTAASFTYRYIELPFREWVAERVRGGKGAKQVASGKF